MKTLVLAVQSQIQASLAYVRDGDVYITPNLNLIPVDVRFPCVGIKDGPVQRVALAGSMVSVTRTVRLAACVEILKDEASLIGDAATGDKGALEIVDDLHAALDEELLGLTGCISARFDPQEPESEIYSTDQSMIVKKRVNYHYTYEEARP